MDFLSNPKFNFCIKLNGTWFDNYGIPVNSKEDKDNVVAVEPLEYVLHNTFKSKKTQAFVRNDVYAKARMAIEDGDKDIFVENMCTRPLKITDSNFNIDDYSRNSTITIKDKTYIDYVSYGELRMLSSLDNIVGDPYGTLYINEDIDGVDIKRAIESINQLSNMSINQKDGNLYSKHTIEVTARISDHYIPYAREIDDDESVYVEFQSIKIKDVIQIKNNHDKIIKKYIESDDKAYMILANRLVMVKIAYNDTHTNITSIEPVDEETSIVMYQFMPIFLENKSIIFF
jgi:hypothetical protein